MSPLTRRIVLVTGGLILTGGVLGAIAGATALWLAFAVAGGKGWGSLGLDVLTIPAVLGAMMGAVGLPIVAWTLLRRVSLGRVFALSVAGTILGGVAGWVVSLGGNEIAGGVRGAVAGFVLAAVAMWIETRFARRGLARSLRPGHVP